MSRPNVMGLSRSNVLSCFWCRSDSSYIRLPIIFPFIFLRVPSRSIAFHRVPSRSIAFHRVPSHSIAFHRVPSRSIVFHRVPSRSFVLYHAPITIPSHIFTLSSFTLGISLRILAIASFALFPSHLHSQSHSFTSLHISWLSFLLALPSLYK